MEASALQARIGLAHRISIGAPLLRLRSDEQLVELFRAGHDEAFRVIYDRYRQRLFAYTRQMLPASRHDAEDALQDIFVRAYSGLRASDRKLALRAWLYRVAHNRCIDELRRPTPPPPDVLELVRAPIHDPTAEAEQRESLRRLVADVRRLPEQQRSALLMRELAGMTYADVATALGVSVPAVKSLLVRARIGLAQSIEARDTACSEIREELIGAHDRGVRPNGMVRRHLRDCEGCRRFRRQVRGVSRQFAALTPALGPLGVLAKFGLGGGGGAAAGGGAAVSGGAVSTGGAAASIGVLATGAGHVAPLLAAAVFAAAGAVELQHTITPAAHHRAHQHARTVTSSTVAAASAPAADPGPSISASIHSTADDAVSTPTAVVAARAVAVPTSRAKTAARRSTHKQPSAGRASGLDGSLSQNGTTTTTGPSQSTTGSASLPATGTSGRGTDAGGAAGTASGIDGTTTTEAAAGSSSSTVSSTGSSAPSTSKPTSATGMSAPAGSSPVSAPAEPAAPSSSGGSGSSSSTGGTSAIPTP